VYVQIGGIEQWIQYGGEKPENPVLLYLHGGPGGTSVPLSDAWKPWEEHFTVVHWDQRGAHSWHIQFELDTFLAPALIWQTLPPLVQLTCLLWSGLESRAQTGDKLYPP
jgi:pimeloyl-ACP methyl ester carboxylesterase